MNVFLYGGKDRFNANIPIITNNEPVRVGSNYTISIDTGMLLVAYPNKDAKTDFEFKYWVADVTEGVFERIVDMNFHGQDGQMIFIIICVILTLILLLLCCIYLFLCRRCCSKKSLSIHILNEDGIEVSGNLQMESAQAAPPNESSMIIEDMPDNEYETEAKQTERKDMKNPDIFIEKDSQVPIKTKGYNVVSKDENFNSQRYPKK